jgi:large subunit ribosomal protein L25
MKAVTLNANQRTVIGRTVKNLRKEGVLPGTIYGNAIDPISIQVTADEFTKTYRQTGETGIINLTVDEKIHPVLIKNVQLDPVTSIPIHVEFHQVNLKEKIKANIPVLITGESQAVKEKTGTLLQLLNEIEVEALPTELPEHIEVDISSLAEVNDHVVVKNLVMPEGVTLITDPEIMVVKIGALLAPEPEPTVATEEGAVAEEGETKEEGKEEEPASETKEEPAKE